MQNGGMTKCAETRKLHELSKLGEARKHNRPLRKAMGNTDNTNPAGNVETFGKCWHILEYWHAVIYWEYGNMLEVVDQCWKMLKTWKCWKLGNAGKY